MGHAGGLEAERNLPWLSIHELGFPCSGVHALSCPVNECAESHLVLPMSPLSSHFRQRN